MCWKGTSPVKEIGGGVNENECIQSVQSTGDCTVNLSNVSSTVTIQKSKVIVPKYQLHRI